MPSVPPPTVDKRPKCPRCGEPVNAIEVGIIKPPTVEPCNHMLSPEEHKVVLARYAAVREAEDERRRSVLFNDIAKAPIDGWLPLTERLALRDYLWTQGWRRDVRPSDVTD